MKLNNKAQNSGAFTIVFIVIMFIIGWAVFFAKWLNEWGERAIINNSLVGVEAFIYGNLNMIIFIVLLIFIISATALKQ